MMHACPNCGEQEDLSGSRSDGGIVVTCLACGHAWDRDLEPSCPMCGRDDLFRAVAAVIEKGRGTQLSVVGTRTVYLCEDCDASTIRSYLDGRPNPLMPDQLPNAEGS